MFGRENGAFARNKLDWQIQGTVDVGHANLSLSYIGFREDHSHGALAAAVAIRF